MLNILNKKITFIGLKEFNLKIKETFICVLSFECQYRQFIHHEPYFRYLYYHRSWWNVILTVIRTVMPTNSMGSDLIPSVIIRYCNVIHLEFYVKFILFYVGTIFRKYLNEFTSDLNVEYLLYADEL